MRNKSAARTLYLGAHAGYNIDNSSTDDSPFAPLVLEAGLSVKPLGDLRTSLSSTAFLDWEKRSLEEIAVSGRVQWGRTISLGATWLEYAEDVSRRTFIAPEELVPSSTLDRSAYLSPTEYRTSLSTNNLDVVPWSAYRGMLLSAVFRPMDPLTISGGFSRDFGETALEIDKDAKLWDHFKQLSGSIRWDSPCKCWSAAIMVNKARDRETPDVRFVLDLARLGGITY